MNIYSQLFEILKDAVFGDVVLTTAQQFAIDQICTFMALAVVLAPVIAMVALTVKLMRW